MTRKVTVHGEVRSGRAEFGERLRRLGADEAQVEAFDDRWDDLSAGVRAMSDANLRAVLAEMTSGNFSPEVAAALSGPDPLDDARRAYIADAVGTLSIPATVEWMGTNAERAQAVHEAESRRGDDTRKGMLSAAEAILAPPSDAV